MRKIAHALPPTPPGNQQLVRSPTVYCTLQDPSDVDCRRQELTWIIRVARARQHDGKGIMEDRENHGRAFQPASYRLIHPQAGRKIVAFTAYEAWNILKKLADSGLNIPSSAIEQLELQAMGESRPPVKSAESA